MKESNQTLIILAEEEPFLKALKEDCIGHGRRMPFEMLKHLQTNKVRLKKQVFMDYIKQINKAHKQLSKWNVTVSVDNLVIHINNQMYESDFFFLETMMTWEEIPDNIKSWAICQQFFEATYIACKQ